jgi:putative DNA primase/helicase
LQRHGVDGVKALLASAAPAKLSLDGEIEKLSRLPDLDYARVRKAEAKRLGIQVSLLDKEVRKHKASASPPESDWDDVSTAPAEHEEVDLADTLDGIVKELKRYVVASDSDLATMALWCCHAHLVHHRLVKLTVSPRLGIQARDYGSGKTVTLECIGCLVPNATMASNITASNLFRTIAAEHPTLLLDEVHLLLHSNRNPDLLQIMNASHRRKSAKIRSSEPLPNGGWQPVEYDVWCTMVLASVCELPRDQQERSVVINLSKALGEDVPEHLEDGTSPELELLYTKLVVWAADLEELPRPPMPEILRRQHGRIGDNWRPLLAVAQIAGEQWPQRALDAALAAIAGEQQLTVIQRLLASIRRAFNSFDPPKPDDALETGELLHRLLNDSEEEWDRANHGRAVTSYWLRDNLRGLLDPPKSQEWQVGEDGQGRRHARGYRRFQFAKAWRGAMAGSW